ncbi:MAG: hypothetical protein ABI609_16485 [Acidobacteriota bacterium]
MKGMFKRRPFASLRFLGSLAALALAALHLPLLLQRFSDNSISEPVVLLRWLGALALLAGFAASRRRGDSLVRGRTALVLWLLVLVLHIGMAAPVADHELLAVAPVIACLMLVLAPRLLRAARPRRSTWTFQRLLELTVRPSIAGRVPAVFSPRPPPARFGTAVA